jgi:FMN-dependent oxidoreductase (nitrilotriacetate monooxygenase family)
MPQKRKLRLAAHLSGYGASVEAWRHPDARPDSTANIRVFIETAQWAEKGKFDFGFIADTTYIDRNTAPFLVSRLDPIAALSAIATHTHNLGLVATMTTSFSEPYTTARQLASLDKISEGRAAWNVVTGALEGHALNHGGEKLPEHDLRYHIAGEYLRVVKGLWNSWEDDAFPRNQETGEYVDFDKMHTLDHKGEFFSVKGPLNMERSPQGHPVIFQAGASEAGRDFAAREADAIFAGGIDDREEAKAYYDDIKRRALAYGRSPDEVFIFPNITPFVGATEEEAFRKYEEINGLLDLETKIKQISSMFGGYDFSRFPLDEPLPDLTHLHGNGVTSTVETLKWKTKENNWTLRQLVSYASRQSSQSTSAQFVGTAVQIADRIQRLFEDEVVDGFIIRSNVPPLGLQEFVEQVVPILQQRGIFRTEYESTTLRGNLGLKHPLNRRQG